MHVHLSREAAALEAETAQFTDEFQQPVAAASPATTGRRGRPRKTDLQADEPLATSQAPLEPSSSSSSSSSHHDRVISFETDMTQSVALDEVLDDFVPPYTHQAQGHDSNDMPPLETFQPDYSAPGFVGDEALQYDQLEGEQQQPRRRGRQPRQVVEAADAAAAAQAARAAQLAAAGPGADAAEAAGLGGAGAQLLVQQAAAAAAGAEELSEEDLLMGQEEPPGVWDYEAGLAQAQTIIEPDRLMSHMPPEWRPQSRAEADYRIRWSSWVSTLERQRVQLEYENNARRYLSAQNKESENIYLTAKALSIVTAEIELEDHETGNRWDSYYPVWARAEHRWYPTGRFAAYNEYVKENIGQLTMKYAPGADQEEEFDLMDDVFLMADDPNIPGGGSEAQQEAAAAGPAGGLGLDSFLAGMLPGTESSELGQSYLDEVLAPAEEELEEELE
ncbi:hypothetical protein OEZ86_004577 [Tetradesmus obliquus]|nr:hypothetical protein OEZ86_004577 [Tetradesmus obliquus]